MKIPERNILGLDLGTTCGFAAVKDGHLFSGSWVNPVTHAESPGAYFDGFARWLPELRQWYQPQVVVVEMVYAHSNDWALAYGGMLALVRRWAYRQQIAQAYVAANTLKKFATGHGKCGKDEMVKSMRARWGWRGSDDNEADALALIAWATENVKERTE